MVLNFSFISSAFAAYCHIDEETGHEICLGEPPVQSYPSLDAGNAPTAKYSGALWGINYFNDLKRNVLFLTGAIDNVGYNDLKIVPVLQPSVVRSLDIKMDDGIPDKGSVRGVGTSNSSTGCYSSSEYLKDAPGNLCGATINLTFK